MTSASSAKTPGQNDRLPSLSETNNGMRHSYSPAFSKYMLLKMYATIGCTDHIFVRNYVDENILALYR